MKANDRLRFWLKLAIGAVFFAYVTNFFYAVWSGQQGGTFGDTFGATNSLFSGVALMMLIYAVILQREELSLIKEERDDTRKLLEGQEKINALQEAALRKQIFEQSFNALLKMTVDEKSRLSIVEQIGQSSHISQLLSAVQSARNILRNGVSGFKNEYNELEVSKADHLLAMIMHLDDFIRGSVLDQDVERRLRALLNGVINRELATCWACRVIILKAKDREYAYLFKFLTDYDAFQHLNAEDKTYFHRQFAV